MALRSKETLDKGDIAITWLTELHSDENVTDSDILNGNASQFHQNVADGQCDVSDRCGDRSYVDADITHACRCAGGDRGKGNGR